MEPTLLHRIYALAERPVEPGWHVARKCLVKLCDRKFDQVNKAHAVGGHLRRLPPDAQNAVLTALEALGSADSHDPE